MENKKVHPWRRCDKGEHLVCEHPVSLPPSKSNPEGKYTVCREHCAKNPSGKDKLTYMEIKHMYSTYFPKLEGLPTAHVLTRLFRNADKYDTEIRGWTRYWNDIFKPYDLLDPNIIKALIATESSFDANPKKYSRVYGLMQIIAKTRQYLCGDEHELRDHFLCVSATELLEPFCNICAGIRWLFRKRETASALLKRQATWEEAVEDYKAILELRIHNKPFNPKPMEDFRKYYKLLNEG